MLTPRYIPIIVACFTAACATSPTICQTQPCRGTGASAAPYVFHDIISIMAGETLALDATETGGRIHGFQMIEADGGTVPDLVLEFEKDSDEVILHINSKIDQFLKFHIQMRFEGRDEWYETTSCAVMPKAYNVELWTDPIEELRLFDFRIVEEGSEEANICQY